MQNKLLVAVFSAMILLSGFLSFAVLPPLGSAQSPYGRILAEPGLVSLDPAVFLALPLLAQLFIAGFGLALIAFLAALMGWAPRLLALLTGLLPLGVLLYAWFEGRDLVERLGVTLPSGPFSETMPQLSILAGWGFWIWLAGALLLTLIAVFDDGVDD